MNTNQTIRVGVIGCGHWGPNHIRNFSTLAGSSVVACADTNTERLRAMKRLFPALSTTDDYHQLLANPQIDAVVVATPTVTHHAVASEALRRGKHVLVEKPMALTVPHCRNLRRLARANRRVLTVGHTFLFNTGIRKLKECIASGEVGKIYYLHAARTNLGPIRRDAGVVWDLASHDVAIFNYLLDARPLEVSARAQRFFRKGIEDVAFISLSYPNRVIANVHVSWLDPKKIRQIVISGSKKMLSWDDLTATGPVMIYDKGVFADDHGKFREPYYASYGDFQLLPREGDVVIPHLKQQEPLQAEARHFLECVRGGANTLSGPDCGLAVVNTLVAIQKSIAGNGRPVKVGRA